MGPLLPALKALMLSPFVSQSFQPYFSQLNQQDVTFLANLMQAGKLTPVIDRSYPLRQVPQALSYLEAGHARGKVVIDVQ